MKPISRARPEPTPLRLSGTTREERAIADLVGRLPDATPDELQVARVWRRLHAPEPGPSRVWSWAAAGVMALTLIVGAGRLWMLLSQPQADVLAIEGGVFSGGAGTTWIPVRRGDPIPSGSLLRSDGSGQSLLRISGVAALVLSADADLVLDHLGRSTLLRLERGSVTARVTKRPRGSTFAVRAGDFTVTVVGTIFSVTASGDGRVAVSVREGVVDVAGRGQSWRVQAGQRWKSEAPELLAQSDLPATRGDLLVRAVQTPESPELPGLFRELLRVETAPLVATPTPTSTTATPTPTPIAATPTPTATHRPRPPHPATPIVARLDPAPATYSVVPPMVLVPDTAPPPAAPSPAPTAAPAAVPVRDFYAEALNLTRHGEHQEAARVLERALAAGDGPRDLELYQLALLRQRRLGDAQGSLEALLAYRQQFPAGALRQEVSLSIVEADLALGRDEAALAESSHFLAHYPGNERADELRLLRGDLLRQRGDCAKALAEYHSITGGAALDDASYYGAYCRRELGDGVAAGTMLRDYLTRFPAGKHAAAARQALGH